MVQEKNYVFQQKGPENLTRVSTLSQYWVLPCCNHISGMLCHLLAPLRLFISVLRVEANRRGIKHTFKVVETKIEPFLPFLFTLRNPALSERSDKSMSALFPETAAGERPRVSSSNLSFYIKYFQCCKLLPPSPHHLCPLPLFSSQSGLWMSVHQPVCSRALYPF